MNREGVAGNDKTLATDTPRVFLKGHTMHHLPQPKDQARLLKAALKTHQMTLGHQDALEVVATLMGHKTWKAFSAAFDNTTAQQQVQRSALATLAGPEDGDIYEGLVTVDQTMSATVRVRAHSPEEAHDLLGQAACDQFPHGFELDEGNYRGASDFYFDSARVDNMSQVVYDADNNDFSATASWGDEHCTYCVTLTRAEGDCSDDERRSVVDVSITVADAAGNTLSTSSESEAGDDLRDFLRDELKDGNFEDTCDDLKAKLQKKHRPGR